MSFTCKAKAEREIFSRGSYRIIAFIPLMDCEELKLNKYLNFSVTGEMPWCEIGREYTLELEEGQTNQYGTSYTVKDVKDLELENIDELDADSSQKILEQFMTKGQAQNCIKAYPEFIKIALKQGINGFDISKIHNVGEVYIKSYVRHLNEKFKYFAVVQKFKRYEVSLSDCTELFTLYPTEEKISEEFEKNPYKIMIDIMGRSFDRTDSILKSVRPELKDSDERGIYMILDVLGRNELDGSTRLNGKRLWRVIKDEYNAPQFLPKLKDLSENSDLIYFDENSGDLSKASTYYAECNVASFIKNKLKNSTKLNWDYTKYKQIKDGVLTDEQSNVLKAICENNIVILNAPAGTGKTSTLKAVLQMIEDNKESYVCVSFTGRASKRLSEQTGRPACTIHKACLNGSVSVDWLICDEASMLGLDLISMIVNSISNDNIRILFVGDSEQIQPITVGRIFKDFIESKTIPLCTLTKCFRFSQGGMSKVSTLVRNGEFYIPDEKLEDSSIILGNNKDYKFVKFNGTIEQIVEEYDKLIKKGIKREDITIMTPMNIKEFGSININRYVQNYINPHQNGSETVTIKHDKFVIEFRENDLVMNVKNNYKALRLCDFELIEKNKDISVNDVPCATVFNGEVGKIIEIKNGNLVIQFDEDIIVFNKLEAKKLLLAYASNPFKYQGSQNKWIIVITIAEHIRMLNKQLQYTSLTRASDGIIEIGELETMEKCVRKSEDSVRNTWTKELLESDN